MKTLQQTIINWIGEYKRLPTDYNDTFDYIDGYKNALSDLRERIPELVELITPIIVESFLKGKQDAFNDVKLQSTGSITFTSNQLPHSCANNMTPTTTNREDWVEKFAEQEHIRWAKWQSYLHSFLTWNNDIQAWVLPHEKK